jgi:ATP-dependent Clp protease ATP-binding subunit ClpA
MFERFTDRARNVMAIANAEAQRLNHKEIDSYHILLGLVKEGSGVGATVLKNIDVDIKKLRLEIEKLVKSGPGMVTMGQLPCTPRAKKVIEFAIEEAKSLNHKYLATEHLWLGLLRDTDSVAVKALMNLGVNCEHVRNEILKLLDKVVVAFGEKCDKATILGFSDRAREILSLARQEAQHFNHESIDTEHILLGFIKEGSGVGMTVLKNLNVDINKLRRDVEKLMIKGSDMVAKDKLQIEPRAKKVIEYAVEGAKSLNRNYIGSEHILLGLMYETKGSISAQALKNHGLQYEQVRNEILKVLRK